MRNILEKVRRRDQAQVKAEAQKICLAKNAAAAQKPFERFCFRWRSRDPAMVRQFEQDLPELQHFFSLPFYLEVRRRSGPWWFSAMSKAWRES